MAEKESKFTTTVESLFKGMDSFISAKTVVGDVVTVNDTIIVPLVDVSFGVAAGAWEKTDKNSAGGGMGGKVKPAAVLVISNGTTKMVPVNQPQDAVTRIIDLVPDVVNRFMPGSKNDDVDPEVEKAVNEAVHKESEI
ncbi:MAG: GerW family sporulation protein [Catenibacillus sp.]